MRSIKPIIPVLLCITLGGPARAQLDPGCPLCSNMPDVPIPTGLPKRWPSVWEGGTNLYDPPDGQRPGDGDLELGDVEGRRRRSASDSETTCNLTRVPLLVPGAPPGELAFIPESCDSPWAEHEIWSWPLDNPWPDTFEIRPDVQIRRAPSPRVAWAFPSVPFDLDSPDPWLADVDPLPGDHLYEVARVNGAQVEVIAWFWFQADETWAQVAYADASLGETLLSLDEGGHLRFTAVEPADLPLWLPVVRAAAP